MLSEISWVMGRGRSTLGLAAACVALLALPPRAGAMVYSCDDSAGHIILRDVPCKRGETSRAVSNGNAVFAPKRKAPAPAAAAAHPLAQSEVQAFIDQIDEAMARRDIAAVLTHFAADAALEMEYHLPQGLRVANLDKTSYAAMLRETLGPGATFTYQRERPRIVLTSDRSQAEVLSDVRETLMIDGKRVQGVTRSRLTVEWRDGRLQITLARGSTRFDADASARAPTSGAAKP